MVGSFNLLNAVRHSNVENLINASTGGAIVGEAAPPVHEDLVANPLSPYGSSKLAMEGYVSSYAASFGIKATSLRFSNVYGPRSRRKGSVVAAFFRKILAHQSITVNGDGSQTRDFVFIDDLIEESCQQLKAIRQGFQLGVEGNINKRISRHYEVYCFRRSFDRCSI